MAAPTNTFMRDVWAANEEVGFAVSNDGRVLRLADGKWEFESGVAQGGEGWGVDGLGPDRVVVAIHPTAESPSRLLRYDGTSWTEVPLPSETFMLNFAWLHDGPNGELLWVSGGEGWPASLYLLDNGVWTSFEIDPSVAADSPLGFYAPTPTDVFVATADFTDFWSGMTGALAHLHYDGSDWQLTNLTQQGAVSDRAWLSVAGSGMNHILASNSYYNGPPAYLPRHELWHFDGANWELIEVSAIEHFRMQVVPGAAFSTQNFYDAPGVRRFDGSSWLQLSDDSTYPSNTVSGAALVEGDQLVVTNDDVANPYLWSFDADDGWLEIPFPGTPAPLHEAFSPDGHTAFAVGDGVALVRFGGSWIRFDIPGSPRLNAIAGTSATDIFAAGDGVILHFDGASWREVYDTGTAEILNLSVAPDGSAVAVGTDCSIFVFDRSSWGPLSPAPTCAEATSEIRVVWTGGASKIHVGVDDNIQVFDGQQWKVDSGGYMDVNAEPSIFLQVGDDELLAGRFLLGYFDGTAWRRLAFPRETGGVMFSQGAIAGTARDIYYVLDNGEVWRLTRLWPWKCSTTESSCDNRMDDDCDGLFDSDDPECELP